MAKTYQIAVDGPVGSGKSTVGKQVAAKLGFVFIDTGAMYRAVALKALRLKIPTTDEARLTSMLAKTNVALDTGNRVFLDGEEVTSLIRSPEISKATSEISAIGPVRERMVDLQRKLANTKSVVMDGRDVGTVILPSAFLKIYLTASVEERVRRRMAESAARGIAMSQQQVKEEVLERDFRDTNRKVSPLRKADDAIEIKTDGMTIDQITERICALARERIN